MIGRATPIPSTATPALAGGPGPALRSGSSRLGTRPFATLTQQAQKQRLLGAVLACLSPTVPNWNAPDVGRRIMQVATIRWDFPQGHADE
jgi:hypothetical protein